MGIRDDYYLTKDRKQEIEDLKDRILMLLTAATSTTKPIDTVQGGRVIGGTKDRNANIMIKVIELEAKLAEKQYAYGLSRTALILSISKVPEKARPVFVKKYCKDMSLTQIADSQKQSRQNICKILRNFEKNT